MKNPKLVTILISIVVFILLVVFLFSQLLVPQPIQLNTPKKGSLNNLVIIYTNPSPLEEATISPTQSIEITFSQAISKSDFKYKLDPEIKHEVSIINGQSSDFGQTFRITFKKPLELGAGFTLFINSDTKVDEKTKLDKDYIFHVRTIGYKGV